MKSKGKRQAVVRYKGGKNGLSTPKTNLDPRAATQTARLETELRFNRVLYYPFIEIGNERWLKTAALYWDTISTIVPEGMVPYRSGSAAAFHDAGVLEPEFVAPGMSEVEDTADDVLSYLETPEGQHLIDAASASDQVRVHVKKFANSLLWEGVHRQKIAPRLHRVFHQLGMTKARQSPWLEIPEPFSRYYMTVLATNVSRQRGRALATDIADAEPLANRALRGDTPNNVRVPSRLPGRVAEGFLASLAFQNLDIGTGTPATKIIRFRDKHCIELGRFRAAMRSLVGKLGQDTDAEAIRSHVAAVYSDEVVPAVEELRGRLGDARISCGFNNLKVSTFMSASPTALGIALSSTPFGPFALAAGVGLSVVLSIANYRMQRGDLLRSSPYSYLLAAERLFKKRRSPEGLKRHN